MGEPGITPVSPIGFAASHTFDPQSPDLGKEISHDHFRVIPGPHRLDSLP